MLQAIQPGSVDMLGPVCSDTGRLEAARPRGLAMRALGPGHQ